MTSATASSQALVHVSAIVSSEARAEGYIPSPGFVEVFDILSEAHEYRTKHPIKFFIRSLFARS